MLRPAAVVARHHRRVAPRLSDGFPDLQLRSRPGSAPSSAASSRRKGKPRRTEMESRRLRAARDPREMARPGFRSPPGAQLLGGLALDARFSVVPRGEAGRSTPVSARVARRRAAHLRRGAYRPAARRRGPTSPTSWQRSSTMSWKNTTRLRAQAAGESAADAWWSPAATSTTARACPCPRPSPIERRSQVQAHDQQDILGPVVTALRRSRRPQQARPRS